MFTYFSYDQETSDTCKLPNHQLGNMVMMDLQVPRGQLCYAQMMGKVMNR